MDRELLFGVLSGALCAPAVWLCSLLPVRPRPARADASAGAAEEERLRWRELVTPLVPAALIVAGLLGWAISEPADAESAGYLLWAVVPAGFVWFRSLVRAIKAALPADARHAAATVGLLRPRIVLREGLEHMLDARALAAAKAHEEAHVRHHDPLRMWLAQISTDLQWPFPGGRRRFRSWLHALEVARDDEAVASGVDPVDLAKAIVTCAAEGHYLLPVTQKSVNLGASRWA